MRACLKLLVASLMFPAWCMATPATEAETTEIKAHIEELVFNHERAKETPLFSPGTGGKDDAEYVRQFKKCQLAFLKLKEFKDKAFPHLQKHLVDERQSIPFRNHYLNHSVGAACYAIISFQLEDRPNDYSSYGYMRKGRDGKDHPKPYHDGTAFDEAGGLAEWLQVNKHLSYQEMQVKCLQWLLEREKAIGAFDPESYFENILPLEIRILERKQETGANVATDLEDLRTRLKNKDTSTIPKSLLPAPLEK
ncbi:hypothetical protein [Verrucomicrobium sp. BvORR106]|uniref:hypothetical protein n=1 Tax=Verrucomicrobium sp. BvORR106 TaxID=1403819 RepID=UPI002240FAFC|nr:hypothetical protein [Verrucomicrobium sp. BvORR106]